MMEYLRMPPSRDGLAAAIRAAGLSDDALLGAMLAHPILVNRPFVFTEGGVRLCRPSELVLDPMPSPQRGAFAKEDGEPVTDAEGWHTTREDAA